MNKKFMSFVLAMVLSVGLGVSSFAGQSYDKYSDDFVNGLMADGTSTITVAESGTEGLKGNLKQTFQYTFGAVSVIKGAGRQYTLMDTTKGFSFSIDAAGGKQWEVTAMTLSSDEVAKMLNMTDEERLEFLKEKGASENFFKVAKMDKDGHLLDKDDNQLNEDDEPVWLNSANALSELLTKMVDESSQGVNHGVTLSMGTGVTGPALTVSEDGKTMATYQTDPRALNSTTGKTISGQKALTAVQQYLYDEKGWMKSVINKTFEMKNTDAGKAKLEQTLSITDITYDAEGVRKDTSYSVSADKLKAILKGAESGSLLDSVQSAIHGNDVVGIGGKIEDNSQIFIVSVTNYSANNSKISSFNNKTGETTMYANNQISYVINRQGDVTAAYRFSMNGVFMGSWVKTGVNENGVDVGTFTFADEDGRALFDGTGTLDDFNNPATEKALREEYAQGMKDGRFKGAEFEATTVTTKGTNSDGDETETNTTVSTKYVPKAGTGTKINKVYIYADQILDTSKCPMKNGYIDMNAISKMNANQISGILNDVGKSLSGFGYSMTDIKTMLTWATSPSTALATTSITHGSWSAKDKSNASIDTAGASAIATASASLGTHKWHSIQLDDDSRMNGISYESTICIGGAAAYTIEHRVITEFTGTKETDPAVRGTFQGTVDIDGKTYVKVKASEVNIMDGNGFQAADGEEILVDISTLDGETQKKILAMKEGDEIMFMGDVQASTSNGEYAFVMKVNVDYGGGYYTGTKAEIDAMRNAINDESFGWVKDNIKKNTSQDALGENFSGGWKAGWGILVEKTFGEKAFAGGKKQAKDLIPQEDMKIFF